MPLPEGIPTVTLTGRFLTPDGRPLAGQVVLRAPSLITFEQFDVILGGPVTAPLDSTGAFEVELPATDAPGMNPSGWSYQVAEQLTGVPTNRIYQILLPAETPEVDLADIAPTDPSTPTYVAVRGDSAYEVAVENGYVGTVEQWLASLIGPQGIQGAQGVKGATGATGPQGTQGIQGAPGSKVYPGPVGTGVGVDGDMSYNLTNGLLYWREGGSWVSKGTFLGPKGDKGDTGPQGIQGTKGDTGPAGAPGVVQSVNGKAEAAVVLAAADVGAVANKAAATGWVQITSDGTHPLTALAPDGTTMFRVTNAGHPYSNSLRATFYNMGIGPTTVDFGGGQYVLGLKNAQVAPSSNPVDGAIMYAEGGTLKVRQGDGTVFTVGAGGGTGAVASVNGKTGAVVLNAADVGALATTARGASNGVASLDAAARVPIAQLPAAAGRNEWTPQALGFAAWSCDPYTVANPAARYLKPQRLFFVGFNITETTTVNRLVMFARGYGGVSTNRYRGAIYRENGTKVVESAGVALTMAGQEAGSLPAMQTNHIGAVPLTVASTTLTPGRYWVAWSLVTGGTADFAFFHVQNESPIATANFWMPGAGTPFARAWYTEGQTNAALPATVSQTAADVLANHDIPIMALANV